ncbi:unnamed protein product [Arabidopsis halleri]
MDSELELISLISQMISFFTSEDADPKPASKFITLTSQLISLVSSLDLDSQPEPESGIRLLISRMIAIGRSVTNSEPEWELISAVNQVLSLISSIDPKQERPEIVSLFEQIFIQLGSLDPDAEIRSLVNQIVSLVESLDTELQQSLYIFYSPQLEVELDEGMFRVTGKLQRKNGIKGDCDPGNMVRLPISGAVAHLHCRDCNGEYHEEYEKAPIEVKHRLHPKHYFQLVLLIKESETRECYCCHEDLAEIFYYCSDCDYAMNIVCVKKPPLLAIDHPKWHKNILALFPRRAFLTCNLCALADTSSPIYMCPPCDFVVHQKCINLPRVIKISRHHHRISCTFSFDQGDWSCGVCRRKIDNDYGGYICTKDGYAAHSRCATQTNVWDGIELEGEPDEIEEEEIEPFVRISNGVIQHFSHEHHHLRLDENTSRDYDDNKQCQACITPVYSGHFYSCTQCDFLLHEECANLSRKIYHPIHPHLLTLVGGNDGVTEYPEYKCSACPWMRTAGFFYECGKEECRFKVHVQCATISEPFVHESHMHPLFLTSKPGEQRRCCVCKESRHCSTNETFNCIECEFALCFECATLPQKVRYKHDKHMLTLCYGEETSTMTYWCEICEGKIYMGERFYMCDEYCCVTIHIKCMIGKDLYMKPGSSWLYYGNKVGVLPNNHMSRPICSICEKRCLHKIVFQCSGLIFCCTFCLLHGIKSRDVTK